LFLFSCSKNEPVQDDSNTTVNADSSVQEDATEPATESKLLSDNVPALDFGGYDFRVLLGSIAGLTTDTFPETETGDIFDDSMVIRNRKIEERFNITFKPTKKKPTSITLSSPKPLRVF